MMKIAPRKHADGTRTHRQRRASLRILGWFDPPPSGPAGEAKPVQPFREIIAHAKREYIGFPRRRRKRAAVENFQNCLDSFRSLGAMPGVDALPCCQESLKLRNRHRLNLRTQPVQRQTMDAREQTAIAPFEFARLRT